MSFRFDNIIDLSLYRRQRRQTRSHSVLYISQDGRCRSLIEGLRDVQVDDIRDPLALRSLLMVKSPELILLDSNVTWVDAIKLIGALDQMSDAPIVMICENRHRRRNSMFLKRAFQAGLCDTLFCPLNPEDLSQTVSVLLKLRRQKVPATFL